MSTPLTTCQAKGCILQRRNILFYKRRWPYVSGSEGTSRGHCGGYKTLKLSNSGTLRIFLLEGFHICHFVYR